MPRHVITSHACRTTPYATIIGPNLLALHACWMLIARITCTQSIGIHPQAFALLIAPRSHLWRSRRIRDGKITLDAGDGLKECDRMAGDDITLKTRRGFRQAESGENDTISSTDGHADGRRSGDSLTCCLAIATSARLAQLFL
jgi:hypothetical protein